jgi:hypothetical protein
MNYLTFQKIIRWSKASIISTLGWYYDGRQRKTYKVVLDDAAQRRFVIDSLPAGPGIEFTTSVHDRRLGDRTIKAIAINAAEGIYHALSQYIDFTEVPAP